MSTLYWKITHNTAAWRGNYVTEQRPCKDCGKHWSLYSLRDEVWIEQVKAGKKDVLCLVCVEKRLGRPLLAEDFVPYGKALINRELILMLENREERLKVYQQGLQEDKRECGSGKCDCLA